MSKKSNVNTSFNLLGLNTYYIPTKDKVEKDFHTQSISVR